MPRAPRKCPHDGCETRITTTPYCPEHTTYRWGTDSRDRTTTTDHRQWRILVLTRDQYRCRIRGPRCIGRATDADHIIPVAEGGAPLDLSNGQAACKPCHASKSSREGVRAKQRIAKQAGTTGLNGLSG